MANRSRVRISGPLAAYVDRFAAELARVGYTAGSASHQLRLLAHLSGWLEQRGRDAKVDRADLARFVAERRAEGRRLYVSMRGIAPQVGAIPIDELLDAVRRLGLLRRQHPDLVAREPRHRIPAGIARRRGMPR